jgi:hypothetical protein
MIDIPPISVPEYGFPHRMRRSTILLALGTPVMNGNLRFARNSLPSGVRRMDPGPCEDGAAAECRPASRQVVRDVVRHWIPDLVHEPDRHRDALDAVPFLHLLDENVDRPPRDRLRVLLDGALTGIAADVESRLIGCIDRAANSRHVTSAFTGLSFFCAGAGMENRVRVKFA